MSRRRPLSSRGSARRRLAARKNPNRRVYAQKPLLEELEPRILLSGPHDSALIAALDAELSTTSADGLAHWSHALTDKALLGRAMPLLGS